MRGRTIVVAASATPCATATAEAPQTLTKALRLQTRSGAMRDRSMSRQSVTGDILTGAALGPVFSSCSPTYALIVAAVVPVSFFEGFLSIVAYAGGLAGMLLLIALLGSKRVRSPSSTGLQKCRAQRVCEISLTPHCATEAVRRMTLLLHARLSAAGSDRIGSPRERCGR